jgi:hypothetical protein
MDPQQLVRLILPATIQTDLQQLVRLRTGRQRLVVQSHQTGPRQLVPSHQTGPRQLVRTRRMDRRQAEQNRHRWLIVAQHQTC